MTYALDTSIIIQLLKNNKEVCAGRDKALEDGANLVIPILQIMKYSVVFIINLLRKKSSYTNYYATSFK